MNPLCKSFIVASLILFVTAFMPFHRSQAAIFDGTETTTGVEYGICLDPAVLDSGHPHYEDCLGVDCDDPQTADDVVRCTSEAAAGTDIAKTSLETTGITHTDDFGDYIIKIVNFALPYLTLAAFVGYVVAGFMYVTAFGNDDQLGKAKKILIWSSLGLILVILSYAITNLLTGELVRGLAG